MTLSRYEHTGNAPATGLAAGINSTATSFTVLSGAGYPTGAVGLFVICLDPGTASEEKVLCSARSGTTFTVQAGGRGYDGTTAASHGSGSTNVTHVLSAAEIDDDSDHIYTTTRFDHDTQYLRRDGSTALTGVTTVAAAPGSSAVGDTVAKGTGPTVALSDHRHGREAFGSGQSSTSAVGDAAADGTQTTLARSDHKHGREGFGTPTNVGTANSAGTATTLPRSDHVHRSSTQAGITTATTSGSGLITITFPTAYTTLTSVVACNGDFNAQNTLLVEVGAAGPGSFAVKVTRGGASVNNTSVTINWVAVGVF